MQSGAADDARECVQSVVKASAIGRNFDPRGAVRLPNGEGLSRWLLKGGLETEKPPS